MSELGDLYQEVILDHNRSPRNFHPIDDADRHADGHNPLCGDRLTVWVRLENERIADVSFVGTGCAISKASASLMTEAVKGKTVDEAEAIFNDFHELVCGHPEKVADRKRLGKLRALAGVAEFPVRVKCATLAWHTLQAALSGAKDPVTTE